MGARAVQKGNFDCHIIGFFLCYKIFWAQTFKTFKVQGATVNMFGGHIIFGTLLACSVCLHLVSTDTCPAGAMPGLPGIPGFPGRDGRDGVKGVRGDPGKTDSSVLFLFLNVK